MNTCTLMRNNLLIELKISTHIFSGSLDQFILSIYEQLELTNVTQHEIIRTVTNGCAEICVSAHVSLTHIHALLSPSRQYECGWLSRLLSTFFGVQVKECLITVENAQCYQYTYTVDHFVRVEHSCELVDFKHIPRDAYEYLTKFQFISDSRRNLVDCAQDSPYTETMLMFKTFLNKIWHQYKSSNVLVSGMVLTLYLRGPTDSTFEFKRSDRAFTTCTSYFFLNINYQGIWYQDTIIDIYGTFHDTSLVLFLYKYYWYVEMNLGIINLKKVCIVSAHFPLDIVKMIQAFII